jgi:TRAP-type transport system periplasmic protein
MPGETWHEEQRERRSDMNLVKRRLAALALVLASAVIIASVAACGGSGAGGENGQGESQTLVLGHGAAPENPRSLAAERFAELVNEGTDGRIEIQIQGSEQLGSDVEMLDSVQAGTLDITANSQGPLSTLVPEVALFGLPFLFSTPEEAYEVVDGEVGDEMIELAEQQGFMVLAWWDNGIRHTTNNVRPIDTPEDLQGLDIRTPDDPMTIDIFQTLGANPTPIDFGELYLALRQGTVDGQENPIVNIYASDLQEVQDYLSLTGHKYEVTPFIIAQPVWDGFSAEDQEVIRNAAIEARDFQREEMATQTEEQQQLLAEDLEINNDVDQEAFQEASRPVYDNWREEYGDLVDRLSEAAGVEQ